MQKLQGHAGKSKNETTKPSNRKEPKAGIKNPDENRWSPIKGQDSSEVEDKTQGGNLKHRKGLTFKIKQEIN